ncbi:7-cyano-7-deazaguanine synthase [Methylosinus sp. KRF6]|jgi:7-cyano-7-deazaguanine synthase|uniref:7-cyano-7-deazaguanine synthase n=1 Tax=Methylosinus sp. KRF6 TaxID=2846853 RepID=UPI001C0AF61A|nr:7-cyano-7-deazaguanine synthase [Methylosinus sp. KRF6]MBU3887152.1 7-cyano-7-deazaguanine synthase [Methylosinus sp. KRF6]
MSFVNLVSGGLDSTLIGVMAQEEGLEHFPLFIDYGQRAARKEWETCKLVHDALGLPTPSRMDLSGFGRVIASGLTRAELDIKNDAFTPGRNLIFLLMGSAYAYQQGASSVAIGLLAEESSLFPDQKPEFVAQAEISISAAMGRQIKVITPLIDFHKADVVTLAQTKGITGTYSCHTGNSEPCGRCIACLEFQFDEEK